jgi:exodeoxyribonuclease V beta subunit
MKRSCRSDPETGTILHRILEIIIKEQMQGEFEPQAIQDLIQEHTKATALAPFASEIFVMIDRIFHTPLLDSDPNFTLSNVPSSDFFLEMEFAFDHHGNMMKGFIDAVFIWKNKFYILDWKTNFLGSGESSYTEENIKNVMSQQDYDLQAAIYTEAVKRYVRQFAF